MKQKDKVIIIIIILILTIISIVSFFQIFKIIINLKGNPKNIIYTGKVIENTKYEVYLKNNNFIEEKILYEDSSYITSLIDNIKIKYNYIYNIDKNIDLNYSYKIIANLKGTVENITNPILNQKYYLLNDIRTKKVNKEIKINENIDIDISFYNNIIDNFLANYNIPINANLSINLIINTIGQYNNKTLNKEHIVEIVIPLGVKTFDIKKNINFDMEENIYLNDLPDKNKSFVNIIIYIIITSISITVGVYFIKRIINKNQGKFITMINKILKDYDNRIVEVKNFVKYKNWETVDVKNFEELINLSNEAFEPIFYWKKRFNQNKEVWFCILRDKVIYRCILHKE